MHRQAELKSCHPRIISTLNSLIKGHGKYICLEMLGVRRKLKFHKNFQVVLIFRSAVLYSGFYVGLAEKNPSYFQVFCLATDVMGQIHLITKS